MSTRYPTLSKLLQPLRAAALLACLAAYWSAPALAQPAAPAQFNAQDEMKKLQEETAKRMAEIQQKISEQGSATAKPGDPEFARQVNNKVVEIETKLTQMANPASGPDMKRPQMQRHIDYVWVLLSGVLVFWMQAGFALVEIGATRSKNAINCAMKGLLDFCSSTVFYLLFGFAIMFGASEGGFMGQSSFWISNFSATSPLWTFWFFQVCFTSAACTIASGAMAERTKFLGYMCYTCLFSALVYPIFGHWAWGHLSGGYEPGFGGGEGWLRALGFHDFAGSTVVHAMGGACALAGIMVVGPRVGRFNEDGTANTIPGHTAPLAFLGAFILWMGWFGFNAGSTLSAGPEIGRIAVNTVLAGSSGGFFGLLLIWKLRGVPDAASTINGLLAGAVGITAGCDTVTPLSALIIGAIAGALCSLVTIFVERLKLDDVVGAVPVHLACGIWGTIAVALFDEHGFSLEFLGIQIFGTAIISAGAFVTAYFVFRVIDVTVGLRASDDDQEMGLDFSEHATNAYADFKTADR